METTKAIERITETPADTEMRTCRRIELGTAIQQGDVYLHRVADDHPRGKRLGTRQVAVGQQVGARHIADGDGVEVYAGDALPPGLRCPEWAQPGDMLGPVIVADRPFCLAHPEHAHHSLPAGVYQVTYQLDYSTRQRVQD